MQPSLPKPQMTNNLGSSFFSKPSQGFNPQSAGSSAIPQIGASIGGAIKSAFGAPPPGSLLNPGPSMTPQSNFSFASAPAPSAAPAATPSNITPTPSGGVAFNPTAAQGFKAAPMQPVKADTQDLAAYIPSYGTSSNGATVASSPGGVMNYSPGSTFSIDHSGPVPSSALASNTGMGDIQQTHSKYTDYVNALAQAEGYSPAYIDAYKRSQMAQLNNLALQSNLYTGNNLPGDTMNYAQGATAKAEAQNALQQGVAGIDLQTQALSRQGSIAGASALVQASQPVGVSPGTSLVSPLNGEQAYSGLGGLTGVNAINQYNTLQQQYPGANIPPYNPMLTPEQNQQVAQQLVSQSPAYQAGFQSTYTTPGGGTGIYNKLNAGGLQQNPDGTYQLVSGAAAALGGANASALNEQIGQYNTTQSAFNTVTSTFQKLQAFMYKNNINTGGVPAINQLQDQVRRGVISPGAVGAFENTIQELRTNMAQVVSRGGSIAGTNQEAEKLIPDNFAPSDMAKIGQAIHENGTTALQQQQQQIQQLMGNLGSGTAGGGLGGGSMGGQMGAPQQSVNPFSAENFFGNGQ